MSKQDIFLELQRHGLSKLALTFTGISLKFLKQRMIKLLERKKLEFLAGRFLVLLPGVVQHWFLLLLEQGLVQPYFPLPLVSGLVSTSPRCLIKNFNVRETSNLNLH